MPVHQVILIELIFWKCKGSTTTMLSCKSAVHALQFITVIQCMTISSFTVRNLNIKSGIQLQCGFTRDHSPLISLLSVFKETAEYLDKWKMENFAHLAFGQAQYRILCKELLLILEKMRKNVRSIKNWIKIRWKDVVTMGSYQALWNIKLNF